MPCPSQLFTSRWSDQPRSSILSPSMQHTTFATIHDPEMRHKRCPPERPHGYEYRGCVWSTMPKENGQIRKGGGMADPVILYTASGCPYSAAAREDLEWRGVDFVEYDVEKDRK